MHASTDLESKRKLVSVLTNSKEQKGRGAFTSQIQSKYICLGDGSVDKVSTASSTSPTLYLGDSDCRRITARQELEREICAPSVIQAQDSSTVIEWAIQ